MSGAHLRPPPLRRALALTLIVLVAVGFVLATVLNVVLHEIPRAEDRQTQIARQLLDTIQQSIGRDLVVGDARHAESILALYGTYPDIDLVVATDAADTVVLSTRFAYRGRAAAEVADGLDTAALGMVRKSRRPLLQRTGDGSAIVAYAPLTLAARPGQLRPAEVGVLYLRYDLRRARANAWRTVLAPGYWTGVLLAVAVSGLVLIGLLNHWVSNPLRHLGQRVDRLAAGDFDVRSGLQGNSELGRLGQGFDRMSAQISASRLALEHANRDLEDQVRERTRHLEEEVQVRRTVERALKAGQRQLHSVLEALGEGVALWDAAGALRYANPSLHRLWPGQALVAGETCLAQVLTGLRDKAGKPLAFHAQLPVAILEHRAVRDGLLVRFDEAGTATRWFSLVLAPLDAGKPSSSAGLVLSLNDVTDIQSHSESLARLANYDRLTGLPNRNLLHDRMAVSLAHDRRTGRETAVCYVDLDGFKDVNDAFGHEAGDALLQEVARRLSGEMRSEDTVARLGGDEFVLLLGDLTQRWDCEPVLQRVLDSLSEPYRIDGELVDGITASIGVTLCPNDDSDPDTLLRHADHTMYAAKRAGKNRIRWFNPDHERRAEASEQTLGEIAHALRVGDLVLHFQPKVDCRAGSVVGAEALLRWQHPVLGMLPPAHFVPLIEDNELAVAVGDFAIREALAQICEWRQAGYQLTLSVNVFVRQLQQADFVDKLAAQIADSGCGERVDLELEIIESAALEGVADIGSLVESCRKLGVSFALDDFGTGYSTLDHLLRIPAGVLKIDRTFVRDMLSDPHDRTLVQAIIGLGESFDLSIVAEGVEAREQALWLLRSGCDVMQGSYFAEPMAADQFIAWVDGYAPDPAFAHPDQEPEPHGQRTRARV
ncbi:MAG: EAL domain-containing protein [Gammaproteobacteria bacterium]|nr:EAL domain-containing protein [Gammaproteobacteria bacterium]